MDADAYLAGFGESLGCPLTQDEWEDLRAAVTPIDETLTLLLLQVRRQARVSRSSLNATIGVVGQARRGHGLPGAASDFRPGLFVSAGISRAEARTGSLSSLYLARRWRLAADATLISGRR